MTGGRRERGELRAAARFHRVELTAVLVQVLVAAVVFGAQSDSFDWWMVPAAAGLYALLNYVVVLVTYPMFWIGGPAAVSATAAVSPSYVVVVIVAAVLTGNTAEYATGVAFAAALFMALTKHRGWGNRIITAVDDVFVTVNYGVSVIAAVSVVGEAAGAPLGVLAGCVVNHLIHRLLDADNDPWWRPQPGVWAEAKVSARTLGPLEAGLAALVALFVATSGSERLALGVAVALVASLMVRSGSTQMRIRHQEGYVRLAADLADAAVPHDVLAAATRFLTDTGTARSVLFAPNTSIGPFSEGDVLSQSSALRPDIAALVPPGTRKAIGFPFDGGTLIGLEPPFQNATLSRINTAAFDIASRMCADALGRVRDAAAVTAALVRAHTDPLTGLLNRAGWEAAVLAEPTEGLLVFLDVDHLKKVNDTQGHDRGDALLVEVGRRLVAACPPPAVVSRHAGDEYVVWLPSGDENEAAAVGALLDAAFENLGFFGDGWCAGVSHGVVHVAEGADIVAVRDQADAAMYRMKNARKAAERSVPAGELSAGGSPPVALP